VSGTHDPVLPILKLIDVTPGAGTESGWTLLSVATMPSGLRAGSAIDNPGAGLGSQVTRFSRRSSPVLRQVQLGQKGRVEVLFSEPVVFDPTIVASALRVSAPDGSACSLVPLPTVGRAYERFSFDCSTSAWSSQAVNVIVSPGLESATGVSLGVLREKGCAASPLTTALNLHLDFSSANGCSTGCKELSVIEPDTTPPQVTASVDPACISPPNHKMVLFSTVAGLTMKATDECDPSPTVRVVAVVSDQSPLGGGSGNTAPDTAWGASAFCVRSERDGTSQPARHYTATIEAVDASGNKAQTTVVIAAPHDQAGVSCDALQAGRVVADADPRCTQ
jgi:hypothetical protein